MRKELYLLVDGVCLLSLPKAASYNAHGNRYSKLILINSVRVLIPHILNFRVDGELVIWHSRVMQFATKACEMSMSSLVAAVESMNAVTSTVVQKSDEILTKQLG